MEVVRRGTAPLVANPPAKHADIFVSTRTMSPFGAHHHPDEAPGEALGRIVYENLAHKTASAGVKRRLSQGFHVGYGLVAAGLWSAFRGQRDHWAVLEGLAFGAGLWLLVDELAIPLLGLSDKPSEYHTSHHISGLAQHLAFGLATAGTAGLMAKVRGKA